MKQKYMANKTSAKQRNIEFRLTFEEWRDWWLATGHFHERGRKRGQYAMARYGDVGPYALGNIQCITNTDNVGASNSNRVFRPETLQKLRGNKNRLGCKASPLTRLRCSISARRRCGLITD